MSTGCSNKCFSFVSILFKKKKGNKLFCSTCFVAEAAQQRFGVKAMRKWLESKEASSGVFRMPSCGRCLGAAWLPDQRGAAWLRELRRHSADLGKRTGQRAGGERGSGLSLHSWLALPWRAAWLGEGPDFSPLI